MGGSPNTPNIPNYNYVAGQQTGENQAAQRDSMVNQSNPYGYLNYAQTGTDQFGNPTYTANMGYDPATYLSFTQGQAGAGTIGSQIGNFTGAASGMLPYAQQNFGMAGNTANQSNSLINTGLGEIASGNYGSGNNVAGTTNALTNQMMGNELGSLSPFFNMQNDWQNADLQNRGLTPGSEAYNNARYQTERSQGGTMASFLAQAQPQAFNEAVQQYTLPATVGEGLLQSGVGTGMLGQGYSTAGYGANASAAGLLGGANSGLGALESMVPGLNSTLTSTPGLQPANYIGAAQNYQSAEMQAYQAQMAQNTGLTQAGGSLAGAAMMAMML
jgi:hypothetical protein